MSFEQAQTDISAQLKLSNSPIIDLIVGVGSKQRTFRVQELLLKSRSPYFRNALKKGQFSEGEERVIRFPEEEPFVVSRYLTFLRDPKTLSNYSDDQYVFDGEQVPRYFTLLHIPFDVKYRFLAKVYVLAEMLMDDKMKADILKQLRLLGQKRFMVDGRIQAAAPPSEGIRILYNGTPEDDDVRYMLVDQCVANGYDSDHFRAHQNARDKLPPEYLYDLSMELMIGHSAVRQFDDFNRLVREKDSQICILNSRIAELKIQLEQLSQ
ncbi:hypothetical protein N0V94_003941 [Neodidymelliopsis sp. IMI 364377]|nr:hypothetical protein N0V94_003941 [Neodidymelliopsis sp. IMI 364377]